MSTNFLIRLISFFLVILFILLSLQLFDIQEVINVFSKLVNKPFWLVAMIIIYASAFLLRAYAWSLYLNRKLSFKKSLDGLWYSLFINHLVPFKVGDLVRMKVAVTDKKVSWEESVHSVVVLRLIDVLILLSFSGMGMAYLVGRISVIPSTYTLLFTPIVAFLGAFILKMKFNHLIERHISLLKQVFSKKIGYIILLLVLLSWVCEGIVVFGTASYFATEMTSIQAVWVNSMTVGGSVFQVAPGGLATYESMMSLSLYALNIPWEKAYHIAFVSHVFKFLFSYVVGLIVILSSSVKFSIKEAIKIRYIREGGNEQ